MSESSPDPEWSPGVPLQLGPFAILVGAVLWLARHFYELPERLPIHWNWRGEADGFVERSGFSAALPLGIGLLVCLLLAAFQAGLRRSAPAGAMRTATIKVLLAGGYFTAFICCGVLAASASSGRLLKPVLWLSFSGVIGLVAFAAYAARGIPREPVRNPSAWRAGMFYVDRDDPALFVPKRTGLGYTFNFGHPAALLITLGTLVLPLIVALAALLLR
jgi:uncharacterized membrane protein